jgi:hypothetical protein
VQKPEHRPGDRRNEHAAPQIPAHIDGEPAGKGASNHDPLDAEIEHAGTLADQLSHGGEYQRRGDADGRDPEAGGKQDLDGLCSCHLQRTR